ncbi:hypothetical protein OUZ56_031964 [Daphnia magna]|uniref:Uncharacterized protein n=1 Tax=Daphnia magna TaxID=35525 RepID=A0ABQ9ZW39_9CRUS|nr:hypothetical protein OUZ56_031964 [Daphnia magna]
MKQQEETISCGHSKRADVCLAVNAEKYVAVARDEKKNAARKDGQFPSQRTQLTSHLTTR